VGKLIFCDESGHEHDLNLVGVDSTVDLSLTHHFFLPPCLLSRV